MFGYFHFLFFFDKPPPRYDCQNQQMTDFLVMTIVCIGGQYLNVSQTLNVSHNLQDLAQMNFVLSAEALEAS
jgi:hypothetical protein